MINDTELKNLTNYLDNSFLIKINYKRLVNVFDSLDSRLNKNTVSKELTMTRFFKFVISILVVIGIVAVAPAKTTVVKTDQEVCLVKPGCSNGDQIASAEIKKKKKKKGLKKEKGKKKKGKFFSKLFGSK